MLRRTAERLYRHSPHDNLLFLRKKLAPQLDQPRNDMLDDLTRLVSFPRILAWALDRLPHARIVLHGYDGEIRGSKSGKTIVSEMWNWGVPITPSSDTAHIICQVPTTGAQWEAIRSVRAPSVYTLGEVVALFSQIPFLMKKLDYYFGSADEIMPFYLGEEFFGPLRELDLLFPLHGKGVIEFGPFDGCQTLGLAHLGANVTSIEARAENVTKTRAALDATGMPGTVRMDDFHNVDAAHYGRFDLAFAHGVYYHSIAPFLFLENLISLSDSIFLGGFCATDVSPQGPWHQLTHDGRVYRVKPYREGTNYTAGINEIGYFFDADELMGFFGAHDFSVEVVSDENPGETAGRFIRFLATRQGSSR